MQRNTKTIFALATGYTKSAIAVIRISGGHAKNVVTEFSKNQTQAESSRVLGRLEPRKMIYSTFYHPKHQNRVVDRGMLVYFPGPNSATGEDLVELHLHGGLQNIDFFLEHLSKIENFTSAEPVRF